MRKKIIVTLACILTAISILYVIPVEARRYTHVSGKWTYRLTRDELMNEYNGYIFVYGEEEANWTGGLDGNSFDIFNLVVSPPIVRVNGIIFFEGSIGDREGTLVIKFVGRLNENYGLWRGTWIILEGTGELENAHGYGIWKGAPFNLDYSGKVYFR